MAKQLVNIGTSPSDGSGDPLRISFDKINQNFTELYNTIGNVSLSGNGNVVVTGSVSSVAGKTGNVVLYQTDIIGSVSKGYVDNQISLAVANEFNTLVDGAVSTLDTLKELAHAIGDNPNFSTDIFAQISNRLPLAGGTLTGPLFLNDDPISALQSATKRYVDNVAASISLTPGPVGPKGDKGDTGLQGPIGLTGANSTVPGPVGPAGPKGDTGDKGDKGDTGLQGPIGLTGANSTVPGPVGPAGPKGDKGDPGSMITANVAVNNTTISTVNPNASLVLSPNGNGEVHITADIGVMSSNPGFSIQLGGDPHSSGDLGLSFNDGASFNGTTSLGWAWDNGAGDGNHILGYQHAKFGIFKNGSINSPWVEFDRSTPAYALSFDATGNATLINNVKFGTVPTSAVGKPGDKSGMVTIGPGYIYFCSADYDGAANIWTRTPINNTW